MGNYVAWGALLFIGILVSVFAPAAGIEVVDDNLPNVHPWLIVRVIGEDTGIWPAYNITGQEAYDLYAGIGKNMGFVSLRKGKVFPVYKREDVTAINKVKYPETQYPIMLGVLGGTFAYDVDTGNYFQIVDSGNGKPEVYSWKP
ncbi:MAG: hypothetical protein MUO26_10235 [Methanotrichaceae archaeon]|nr:hypothetical protein [Methanotrichaceae archaeon]